MMLLRDRSVGAPETPIVLGSLIVAGVAPVRLGVLKTEPANASTGILSSTQFVIPTGLTRIPPQQPPVAPFAVSAEEYTQLGHEFNKQYVARGSTASHSHFESRKRIKRNGDPVQSAMRLCAEAIAAGRNTTVTVRGDTITCDTAATADVSIHDVYNLAQRVRPSAAVANRGIMTPAMRECMDTGKYPTLQDHLNGLSPKYRMRLDALGNEYHTKIEPSHVATPSNPSV